MEEKTFLENYGGRFFGVTLAIVCCVLLFTLGFWKTLLISILSLAGFLIGYSFDKRYTLKELLNRILSRGE